MGPPDHDAGDGSGEEPPADPGDGDGEERRGDPGDELEHDAAEVVLALPDALRSELKRPLGPVYADREALLAAADPDAPLVAVGDVVTYHLLGGRRPDVALIDGRTEREAVDREIRAALDRAAFPRRRRLANPAGTLTAGLLRALPAALDDGEATLIEITDGEEDLAALPAVLLAPEGASVVYGQPGEGMVLARVDEETRAAVRGLLDRFEGDHERAYALLGVA